RYCIALLVLLKVAYVTVHSLLLERRFLQAIILPGLLRLSFSSKNFHTKLHLADPPDPLYRSLFAICVSASVLTFSLNEVLDTLLNLSELLKIVSCSKKTLSLKFAA
ncbi:16589_t:CDS:1, partial [Funneliformis caledonium]